MFPPSPFNRDRYRGLPIPTAFSYSNYIVPGPMPHLRPSHTHDPLRQHRHMQNTHSPRHRPSRHRRETKRHAHYSDLETSSSEPDTPDDAYYRHMSPPSSPSRFNSRPHGGRRSWEHNDDTLDIASGFRRLHAKVSRHTAEHIGRGDILILPPTLTRLRVQMKGLTHPSETLHATVAGDMQFRDVVRQLVPERYHGEVRAYVKMRGAWQEPGRFLVSQIMEQGRSVLNERGELDVKIEIGERRGGGGGGMEGGMRGVKAWERERGRTWEIRDV